MSWLMISIDELAAFCKRKGFVYANSEIYGGLAGFYDFGPYGVELKNNIKAEWWKAHVTQRDDVVGIDGSIITNPKVWEASGHVSSFTDVLLDCKKCGSRQRADQFIEEKLRIQADSFSIEKIKEAIAKHKLKCPKCGSDFAEPKSFNLMFTTNIGPIKDSSSIAYLRPETAQLIFTNFRLVQENARAKLPFGIAQIGKAFRNEISPRDFLFRVREFEQMEIEYFIDPKKTDDCPYLKQFLNYEMNVLTAGMQKKKQQQKKMKVKALVEKKIMLAWHAYWLAFEHKWFVDLGAKAENLRIRQHLQEEKSHYALDTWDLEYNFPFGWKELQGIANRTDFDLKQHMKHSKKDLSYFDQETRQKIVPHVVAEPSLGVERTFLVFLLDAYEYDKKRDNIVLKLHPRLAPVKVAVFPLVSNKKPLVKLSKDVYEGLKGEFNCFYDESGSVGKRYARQDELGTPYCVTIDFDSLKKKDATIRDKNSTKQVRVKIKDLKETINKLLNQEVKLEKLGKVIK
jgi:glycyl-tRNA synthetase